MLLLFVNMFKTHTMLRFTRKPTNSRWSYYLYVFIYFAFVSHNNGVIMKLINKMCLIYISEFPWLNYNSKDSKTLIKLFIYNKFITLSSYNDFSYFIVIQKYFSRRIKIISVELHLVCNDEIPHSSTPR